MESVSGEHRDLSKGSPYTFGEGNNQSPFGKCSVAAALSLVLVCLRAHLSLVCTSLFLPPCAPSLTPKRLTCIHKLTVGLSPQSSPPRPSGGLHWSGKERETEKDTGDRKLLTESQHLFSISELECRLERAARETPITT